MSRSAAAGFIATVAILVPAGWHMLDANIEKDGKHLRPMQQTLDIDGVSVALDVDRSVVMTGDTVMAKLVATSDMPKDVKVDLRDLARLTGRALDVARRYGARLVAEHVADRRLVGTAVQLGFDLLQGDVLGAART